MPVAKAGQTHWEEPMLSLVNDHEPLLREITHIYESICEQEKVSEPVNWNQFIQLLLPKVKYFYEQIKAHTEAEEELIFPLVKDKMEELGCIYFTLDFEHKQINQYLSQFISIVSKRKNIEINVEALVVLSNLKMAYLAIRDHFQKEEQVLFPNAQKELQRQ